jgi:hypothetical protein
VEIKWEATMPSKRQQQAFLRQKCEALTGLIQALSNGKIPDSSVECPPSERYLTTGNIIELLDDQYLRVPKSAMLAALRDVGVHHDSNNRFTVWRLHDHLPEIHKQHAKYVRALVRNVERMGSGNNQRIPSKKPKRIV